MCCHSYPRDGQERDSHFFSNRWFLRPTNTDTKIEGLRPSRPVIEERRKKKRTSFTHSSFFSFFPQLNMSASAITNKKVYKREREREKKLKVWLYITRWIDCHRPATIKGLRSRRYIYTHIHSLTENEEEINWSLSTGASGSPFVFITTIIQRRGGGISRDE